MCGVIDHAGEIRLPSHQLAEFDDVEPQAMCRVPRRRRLPSEGCLSIRQSRQKILGSRASGAQG